MSTVDPAAVPGRRRAARAGAIRGGDPDAVLRVGPRDDPAVPR